MQRKRYKLNSKEIKRQKGITLVLLIITVIIMLILAGVAIETIVDRNGLFNKTRQAVESYKDAQKDEEEKIQSLMNEIDKYFEGTETDTTAPTNVTIESSNIEETTFTLTATGTDEESGIAKYEFYINNVLEKTITTAEEIATYYVTGKTADTTYTCKVRVYDSAGNYTDSSEIKVITRKIVKLEPTYIGTRQFIVQTLIENGDNEIIEIEYFVDGVLKVRSEERKYISEELQENSTHKIYAKVYNSKGESWETNELTITTEPRTYLYKEGNQCTELTGGWTSEAIGIGNSAQLSRQNLVFQNNYMQTWCGPAGDMWGGSILIRSQLDYSEYNKIYVDYTAYLGEYNSNLEVRLVATGENMNWVKLCYTHYVPTRTIVSLDITNVTMFYIYLQCGSGTKAGCNIFNVWLEK